MGGGGRGGQGPEVRGVDVRRRPGPPARPASALLDAARGPLFSRNAGKHTYLHLRLRLYA